jgi:hypothetical protein
MHHPISHVKTAKGNTTNVATLFRLSISFLANDCSQTEIRFVEKRTLLILSIPVAFVIMSINQTISFFHILNLGRPEASAAISIDIACYNWKIDLEV